ncbi:uncharacterized protein C9orf50 isoform X1 [Homo sapiens]|uniref:Uncharacterized protein C9orf50 n=2 Tax=Homo sapiens TaxID=9606 RepID=CI050_HUMAN|nr:uncharacterized protein C9orf50 [Homo sapiens]XP_011516957.1 uncharacterized protein C9orf50 isoform X1 [Homo sapiens]XP_011516958.1 uncharacterized protein C9orf50 isoform X1 [Homo sapiens]XP_054218915.1 uncharacterized protein C9orf50 isoform X1 [Homo sapiens]XP_054218916.1 uncharacterized protein C9orf50 isoform X1 [Homo sapiens]Q5SZB4.1 RecName: Full=Uncharacterized protein C9orf50 [Homo sapiens]|eukprot:NP_955382.3 uncharacterized protein C9orf50 [Homo sapiens]
MFWRRLRPGAQDLAPKGLPGDGDFRRSSDPRLPKLTPPALRAALGARGSGDWRIPGGGAAWWPEGDAKPGVGVGRLPPRLPALLTATRRAVRKRGLLRSLLPPPLLSAGASRESAPRQPGPGERERPRRRVAREDPDFLGAFLGELLPSRFREFLHQLQEKCAEEPEPLTSPAPQHQRGVLEHCPGSPRCPNCSFLPDLWGQSSHLQDSLTKISLQQTPILGPLKGDHSQFTTVRKANHRPHGAQVPRLKAALTHNPSGEGSRPCRQRCPFRVRFADETLQDTTLRYWERRRSVQQSVIVNQKAALPVASERVFGSVGKRLESLPKALYPGAKEETLASSSCWDCAGLSTQKTQGYLSEDTSMNSSLPFCSWKKAAAQRPRSSLRAFLDPHRNLEQESLLPNRVLQSVLKQGCPKGYHLLLASATLQPDKR